MPYKVPSLSALIARGQADLESRLPGTFARTAFSVENAIAFAHAGNTAGLHDHLAWIAKQIVPHLSDDDVLLEHCNFWGVWRKTASIAEGVIAVTAVADSVILPGTRWQRADGVTFSTVVEHAVHAGVNQINVVADAEGATSNTPAGVGVELVSPVINVQSAATVSVISGGAELEPIESLRSRLLFRVQYPPSGGNQFDYVRWALECPNATRAWCIPQYRGLGSVGVMFVNDNESNIFPTAVDIQQVKEYLTAHINPITNQWEGKTTGAELIVESPVPHVLNPIIRVSPSTVAVKQAVTQSIADLLVTLPHGGTLLLSQLRAAISNAEGEFDNVVVSPTVDIYAAENALFVLGAIEWR